MSTVAMSENISDYFSQPFPSNGSHMNSTDDTFMTTDQTTIKDDFSVRDWYRVMGQWVEFRIAQGLWFYYHAAFIVLGLLGNIFSFVVLTRPRMRKSSTSYYLAALAIYDSLFILFGMLPNWVEELLFLTDYIWEHNMYTAPGWCQVHNIVANSARYMSNWIIVAYTVERFISVKYPYKAARLCTSKGAVRAISLVSICCLLINIHFSFTFTSDPGFTSQQYAQSTHYTAQPCLSKYPDMVIIWNWLEIATLVLIPLLLIMSFNGVIIYQLWKFRSERKSLGSRHGSVKQSNPNVENKITVMLLVVSTYFVVANLPRYSFLFYDMENPISGYNHAAACRRLVSQITLMLLHSIHATNFLLYCISGERFRKTFKGILCCCCIADDIKSSWLETRSHGTATDSHSDCNAANNGAQPGLKRISSVPASSLSTSSSSSGSSWTSRLCACFKTRKTTKYDVGEVGKAAFDNPVFQIENQKQVYLINLKTADVTL